MTTEERIVEFLRALARLFRQQAAALDNQADELALKLAAKKRSAPCQ